MAVIELKNVVKKYGGRTVVDDVSARFEPGSIVSLIGPSGGGKTTMMRCLNGLEAIDAGEISIGDDKLVPGGEKANAAALRAIRQRVGFVFQQWNLFAHRTALGNIIEAPVHVQKRAVPEATEKARELLKKVGMSHREGAYPAEMSGGEQQRVAIARALAMEPKALLLDEPTSALDPERVNDVKVLLEGIAAEGITMVLVTHSMRFAKAISSRVLMLYGGKIIEDGPPEQVFDHPTHERAKAFLELEA